MAMSMKDSGIAQVLLQRLDEQLLPFALELKRRTDKGGLLTDYDQMVLKDFVDEARSIPALLERHPEFKPLAYQVFALFEQVTAKALENELASSKKR